MSVDGKFFQVQCVGFPHNSYDMSIAARSRSTIAAAGVVTIHDTT